MAIGRPKEHDAGREKVRRLLERHKGEWVSLREIVRLGVAQYNARILELRREGLTIDNKTEYVEKRKVSWFRLRRPGQTP
jgi:hypothetical protein